MKITKRRQRALRKLVLPLIAIAMMTTMMFVGSRANARAAAASSTAAAQP